jgi:glutamate racemase
VLGCTHFPVLAAAIRKVLPAGVCLVDSAETTAESVAAELAQRGLLKPGEGPAEGAVEGAVRFFATDDPERFAKVGEIFLGRPLSVADITLVDL